MSVNVSYKGTVHSYGVSRAMLVQNLKEDISWKKNLHQFKLMLGQAELLDKKPVIKYLSTTFTLCYDSKEAAVEINDFTLGIAVVNPEQQKFFTEKATPEMTVGQLKERISRKLNSTRGKWTLKKHGEEVPDGDLLKAHIEVKTFTVNIQDMRVFIKYEERHFVITTRSDMTILELKRLCSEKIGISGQSIKLIFNGYLLWEHGISKEKTIRTLGSYDIVDESIIVMVLNLVCKMCCSQEMRVIIEYDNLPHFMTTRSDMTILEFKRLCSQKFGISVEMIGLFSNGVYLDEYEQMHPRSREAESTGRTLGSYDIVQKSLIIMIVKSVCKMCCSREMRVIIEYNNLPCFMTTRSDMTILEFKQLCSQKFGISVELIGLRFNGVFLDEYEQMHPRSREAESTERTLGSYDIVEGSMLVMIVKSVCKMCCSREIRVIIEYNNLPHFMTTRIDMTILEFKRLCSQKFGISVELIRLTFGSVFLNERTLRSYNIVDGGMIRILLKQST